MLDLSCIFPNRVVRVVITVFVMLGCATLRGGEQRIWHLELCGIGGSTEYAYPYSPVCFSPDSQLLAISLVNRPDAWESKATGLRISEGIPIGSGIGIWKVESLGFVKWIETDVRKVIRFTVDGRSIVALDKSQLLRWDIDTSKETAITLIEKPTAFDRLRHGFALFPNGKIVAVTSKGLCLFSKTGERKETFAKEKLVDLIQLQLSPDTEKVVADSCYWNLSNNNQTVAKNNHLVHSVFRPRTDEVWAHARFGNSPVRAWNPLTGSMRFPIDEGLSFDHSAKNGSAQFRVESLAFNPTGKVLATAGYDKCIHLWNAATGKRLVTLEVAKAPRKRGHLIYGSSRPTVKIVRFSPDGRWLLGCERESISMFSMDALKPHIKPDKVWHVVQYFAGTELIEEIVTDPPGGRTTVGTMLHTEEQQPGARVAALRGENDEVWYDAVVLGKAPIIYSGKKGFHYDVHYEGYSREDDEMVPEWRLRPKLAAHLKMHDLE